MNQLKVGLVIGNQGLWAETQTSLKTLPVRVLLQTPSIGDMAAFLEQIERLRLDVLLIDLTHLTEPFESVIRKVKSSSSAPNVIALHETASPEVILGAVRAGASEFLYPPIDAGLHKALERLAADRARLQASTPSRAGRTMGFVSAKGGCGATTLCCHLSVEIQKATGQEVLLADLDVDAGLIAFLMKSKSSYTILDAVRNVHRLDASYWKALVSNGHAGLEVISAPPAATVREPLDPDQFREVLRFARSNYDWVVADLGRGLNTLAAELVRELDELYLVATLDLPSLHQAKQVVQAVLDAGYNRNHLRLILNRMPKRPDIEIGQLQRVLGVPVFESLPNDYPELFEAYAQGSLLPGSSELGRSLTGLAGKIAGVAPPKERGRAKLNLSFF